MGTPGTARVWLRPCLAEEETVLHCGWLRSRASTDLLPTAYTELLQECGFYTVYLHYFSFLQNWLLHVG